MLAVLGPVVLVFGLAFLVPMGVSWVLDDYAFWAYPLPMVLTIAVGLGLRRIGRAERRELQPRDAVLLVVVTWTLLPALAALPLMIHFNGHHLGLSWTHAYFEAVSALTTSGGTVLSGLDRLPPSINVWRTFLQWLGGMGILVMVVAILPMLGVGGSQLFRAEAAGPLKDQKLTPRITETAKGLWSVYVVLSLSCFLAYWAGGMTALDAAMHMFTTVSLGGLSSYDASFAAFASVRLEMIAVVFMLLASCNFSLYFMAVRKRSLRGLLGDIETRGTLVAMLGGSLLVAVVLWARGTYDEPLVAMRHALFNVVSIASTTGYASVDFVQWPVFAPVLMLMLSGLATSAGSTGCGIKMIRLLILLKQARRELTRLVHPRSVQPVSIGGVAVSNEVIFSVLGFMLVYGVTIIGLSMLLMLAGVDLDSAVSAVMASVHCMGPGLGQVGPASNFAVLGDFEVGVLTIAMIVGRLELLAVLALFTPSFWRR